MERNTDHSEISFFDTNQAGEVKLVVKGNRPDIYPLSPLAVEVSHRAIGDRKTGYVFLNSRTITMKQSKLQEVIPSVASHKLHNFYATSGFPV